MIYLFVSVIGFFAGWIVWHNLHKECDMEYHKAEMSGTWLGTFLGYLLGYPEGT